MTLEALQYSLREPRAISKRNGKPQGRRLSGRLKTQAL